MNRRLVIFGFVASLLTGCGAKEPYRSGGRTGAYWMQALKQPDVKLRRKAALKIGPIMVTHDACRSAAIEALRDEDAQVRLAAIRLLKVYATSHAASVAPALRRLEQTDPDLAVRQAAKLAIQEFDKQPG